MEQGLHGGAQLHKIFMNLFHRDPEFVVASSDKADPQAVCAVNNKRKMGSEPNVFNTV
jgi:hypothetical protein